MAADTRPVEAVALGLIRAVCTDLGVDLASAPQDGLKRATTGLAGALRSAYSSGTEDGRQDVQRAIREGSRN